MSHIDKMLENNSSWVRKKLELSGEDYFENLSKGQSPECLYIGCSDSRVAPEIFTGLEPGEVFVTRNVANVISGTDVSMSCVIHYALTALKVKHVIVCGHYYCGGVKAAMESKDFGLLNPWLQNIKDVYRLHKDILDAIADDEARYKRLVELNVEEQCINIMKNSDMQQAALERGVKIHGWVFDISTGKVKDLKVNISEKINPISDIYNLGH